MLNYVSSNLKMNCIAVEYPGYGCYPDSKNRFQDIESDAETAYDHLINDFKISEENIMVFGRSLGSGPATYLASKRNPGMLVLMSPYKSLMSVAGSIFNSIFSSSDQFKNYERIKYVKSPTFILHGESDALIKVWHGRELYDSLKVEDKEINTPSDMDHNNFDLMEDLIDPLKLFMNKTKFMIDEPEIEKMDFTPEYINPESKNIFLTKVMEN